MKTNQLLQQFNSALLWNGIFYSLHKATSVFFVFSFFKHVSVSTFSVWASSNSIIFIVILFLDCGLRKSIPLYSAIFMKDRAAHKTFIHILIFFEFLLLFVFGIPLIQYITPFFMSNNTFLILRPYITVVFVLEGFVALLRLLFHAHFWQKEFNTLYTLTFLCETMANFYILFSGTLQIDIIPSLLINKIAACLFVIFISSLLLPRVYTKTTQKNNNPFPFFATFKKFLKHSFFMWASTLIKSLTERNVLFPYITLTLGAPIGNLFKVAHDGALFFQRMALKTIGISDTALLAHAQEDSNKKEQFKTAFKNLFKKVTIICIPLLCIGLLAALCNTTLHKNYTTLSLFLIVTIGYLAEVFLSPFERVLETKKEYKKLWISYTPYLIGITLLFLYNWLCAPLSLVVFVLLLHVLRLIGAVLMVAHVKLMN